MSGKEMKQEPPPVPIVAEKSKKVDANVRGDSGKSSKDGAVDGGKRKNDEAGTADVEGKSGEGEKRKTNEPDVQTTSESKSEAAVNSVKVEDETEKTTSRTTTSATEAAKEGGEPTSTEAADDKARMLAPEPPSAHFASLYVGDLAPNVDEEKLKAKFSEVGHVLSTRLCRDALSRRSLGYGYVNFQNHEDAKHALLNLNFESLEGQPMRIMWCNRDPAQRRVGKGNLFIKNLGPNIHSKAIYDTFMMFGPILSCKVVHDAESGKSKGYGFIHFERQESAQIALLKVNGMELDGRKLYVGEFIPRLKRHNLSVETFTNIYVKNFDENVDDKALCERFSKYGPIKSAVVKQSPKGPEGKAYGFVDFEFHDDAVRAVEEEDGEEWDGNKLSAARAMRKSERMAYLQSQHEHKMKEREMRNRSNLYVRFGESIKEDEQLAAIFAPFGTITSVKVKKDEQGNSRQFGFVSFESEEEAKQAQQEMDRKIINGRPLYVAMAKTKQQRQREITDRLRQQVAAQRRGPHMTQKQAAGPLYARASNFGGGSYPQMMSGGAMRLIPAQSAAMLYGRNLSSSFSAGMSMGVGRAIYPPQGYSNAFGGGYQQFGYLGPTYSSRALPLYQQPVGYVAPQPQQQQHSAQQQFTSIKGNGVSGVGVGISSGEMSSSGGQVSSAKVASQQQSDKAQVQPVAPEGIQSQ